MCTPSPDLNRPSPPSQQGPSYTPDLGTRPRCRLRTLAFRDPEYRCNGQSLSSKSLSPFRHLAVRLRVLVLQKVHHGWTHRDEKKTKKKSLYCRYEPSGRDSFGPLTRAVTHHKKRCAHNFSFSLESASPIDYTRSHGHHGQHGSHMPSHSAAVSVLYIEAALVHSRIRPE